MYARNPALSAAPVMSFESARLGDAANSPPRRLHLSGEVLGARYRLLHPLGRGGVAAVHAAIDLDSGRRMAIRLLEEPRHGVVAPRYFAEVRAALNLCHPNIAETFDFGRDILGDGEPVAYVVTEYLEGETLAATLQFDPPLSWRLVLTMARQICLALSEAHEQGIVHCNIGPSTCFRVLSDEHETIKLLDFGRAAFACKRTDECTPAARTGARGSAAPELLAGEPFDRRVDIYALGLLMYRLATHALPYDGTPGQTEPTPMREARPSLRLPAAFEAVVLKALSRDPARRYADAEAMHDALVHAELGSHPLSRLANDPRPRHRGPRNKGAWYPAAPTASSSSLVCADLDEPDLADSSQELSRRSLSSGSARLPAPTRPALLMRAALAMMLATVVARTAWSLLS